MILQWAINSYADRFDDHGQRPAFFEQYGIETAINERPDAENVEGDIHYVLQPTRDNIERQWADGNPVIPLERTIEQMTVNRPAYEPALEIIAEEYDVNVETNH